MIRIPLPRPLDPVRSIKIKIGMILIGAGAAGMAWFTLWLHWFPIWTSVTAMLVALSTLQILAHGMTSPLREMTAAARAMAQGDYTRRVRATSRDEVGQLAEAVAGTGGVEETEAVLVAPAILARLNPRGASVSAV